MGITISYRGTIASLDRVEDFEDRVLDLALELDGLAHIYRTEADKHSSRMVRGIVLDLCPGQETTGLLISPEGWLVGMPDVENAEKGKLAEMPWCRVKTQFGTLDGHVALVEMFAALKSEFFPTWKLSMKAATGKPATSTAWPERRPSFRPLARNSARACHRTICPPKPRRIPKSPPRDSRGSPNWCRQS